MGLFVATACLAAGASAATRTGTTPVPGGEQKFGILACPAGTHVKSFGIQGQFAQYGEDESDLPVELALASSSHVVGGARSTAPSHDGSFETKAVCGHAGALSDVEENANVAPSTQQAVKAKCPRGSSVRLGGFRQTIGPEGGGGAFVMINGLERTSSRTWKVAGVNLSTVSGRLSSFAYCGDSPGRLHAVEKTRTLQSGHYGTATAKCPRGSRFVMGGLRVQHYADYFGDIYVTAMGPAGRRGWSVTGFKYAPMAGHLTAIAYCSG
jgi:hypothetical protein